MQHVAEVIRNSRCSRSELARRAGVSASTITRIEKGEIDPTMGMAARVLAAAGRQLPTQTEALCMPEAIAAARAILEGGEPTGEVAETLIRWASPDGQPRPRALAREAGSAAPPVCRPGAVRVKTDWSFLRVCSAVAATRKRWAASGAPAAERIGATASSGPIIIYAEELTRVAGILSGSTQNKAEGGAEVILLPLDEVSSAGVWSDGGIVWADPIQVILDCYGMADTVELAEKLTEEWGANG